MLPTNMRDLDASDYYARYALKRLGVDEVQTVYACRPSRFSRLLAKVCPGHDERLIRVGDNEQVNIALITDELMVCVS